MRKIIHIDMDAFFASVEQRDNVNYRNKPLVVGYSGPRGVIASASYEARRYGVKSAMSSKVALRKCPHLIFAPHRFDVYESVSNQIMDIFREYTDLVEPLSLDEAFIDVTHNYQNISSATQIAEEIRKKIYDITGLTASAGVSYNKFLAKIASDINKPNGIFVVKPVDAERFVEKLAVEQFFGVGRVTAQRMHDLGIKTGHDLKQKSEIELIQLFGKAGSIYYHNSRGIDSRPVLAERKRKSVGVEITFEEDLGSRADLDKELAEIAEDLGERVMQSLFEGRTLTLKIKYADFKTVSKSKTYSYFITDKSMLHKYGLELLNEIDITPKVRLIGLSVKNSDSEIWLDAIQLELDFQEHDISS